MECKVPRKTLRYRCYLVSALQPSEHQIDVLATLHGLQYAWLAYDTGLLNGWLYFKSQRSLASLRAIDTTIVFTPSAVFECTHKENDIINKLPQHTLREVGHRPMQGRRNDLENDEIYQETKRLVQEAQRKKREALEKACPTHAAYWKRTREMRNKYK